MRIWAGNAGFSRDRLSLQTPKSAIAGRQLAKVSGHTREYSRFAESQLDPARISRNSKIADREPLAIHPTDAAVRRIVGGDIVRVFNDRGAFLAAAVLAEYLQPGVVQIATGAWYDPLKGGLPGTLEKHGNPNVVTMDKGTSRLSQGSVAQTALVEIEKYPFPAPAVTAFDLPSIVADPQIGVEL